MLCKKLPKTNQLKAHLGIKWICTPHPPPEAVVHYAYLTRGRVLHNFSFPVGGGALEEMIHYVGSTPIAPWLLLNKMKSASLIFKFTLYF